MPSAREFFAKKKRKDEAVTVFFVGAGPGDPELLTKKAERIIGECPVCLYAGSLVPVEVVACAPEGALVLDTAAMTLEDTHGEILAAHKRGQDVARVHSGDPSLYGAIAEQIRRLRADRIDYEIIPGVPAYAGAGVDDTRDWSVDRADARVDEIDLYAVGRNAGEFCKNRDHACNSSGGSQSA
jgi:precorrin-4/cobalt-precorrin-4 C11-methyltransferase